MRPLTPGNQFDATTYRSITREKYNITCIEIFFYIFIFCHFNTIISDPTLSPHNVRGKEQEKCEYQQQAHCADYAL
jgi:hypothetical protein